MKLKILVFISLIGLFFGCTNKLNMGYYSVIEKNYIFNANAPIAVVYDKNDLLSAYYVDLIVYELQRQGFVGVYKQSDLPLKDAKNAIFIKLFRSIRSYPNINYSYSMIDDGVSQACYWYGDQFYCGAKTNKTFALSGYSESFNYLSSYHFVLDWYDLNLKKRVLYIDGSVNGKTCGYNLLFRDLISHTITRIDFSRPERYQYYSDLPYYWPCR
ncbi:hypothetical protein BKH41_07325 [Helicobacter sp. 12S02232-10]|uniref:hypothetical protein n=1 Tax=Helicobacter sp. 12S02232-10 TaxID=1476197 RepID=UPI000BA75A25|nr:hypothetical protein [Helicobacter sp. 12S02232-10]PAF47692.1 hypothetical protein BKH41_07325 [Helicobacter sp. 12S02232-10]